MEIKDIIGQEKAKRELTMRLGAFANGEPMPSLLFTAPRGKGKTTLAQATAIAMNKISKEKHPIELSCASIKNMKTFWNSLIIPHVNDRDVTVHFDEAHRLPSDVTHCLLMLLNPNEDYRTSFVYDDMTLDFDQRRATFMFSTTEPHLMFHALVNRCRRIDLEEYTAPEMEKILKRHLKDTAIDDAALSEVASTLRGTPRQAVMIARDIKTYLTSQKKKRFAVGDWAQLSSTLGILPMGLNLNELRVLRALDESPDCKLCRLAAKLQMTPSSVQRDLELYLLARNLIRIDPEGRNLTNAGHVYLRHLDGKV